MNTYVLCEDCEGLFGANRKSDVPDVPVGTKLDKPYPIIRHYEQTFDSWQESATCGCQLCAMRWSRLSPEEKENLSLFMYKIEATLHPGMLLYGRRNNPFLSFAYFAPHDGPSHFPYLQHRFALFVRDGGQDETSNHQSGQYAPSNTTQISQSLPILNYWYRHCLQHHLKCGLPLAGEAEYPTRLIDLGIGSELEPHVRDTSDLDPGFQYFTLSHRWGEHRVLSLRTDNIKEMRKTVPASAMSKSFTEAMLVAKALGVRYIWIDSLCIVQDAPNRSDWLSESAKMHAIYANALCNISATGALDGRDGCFFERSPSTVRPLEVKIALDMWHHGSYLCVDQSFWESRVENQPLTRRAWVVQERFLSQRVLHFDRQQILWECRETQCCETFPEGLPTALLHRVNHRVRGVDPEAVGARIRQLREWSPEPELDAFEVWNSVVEAYTQAELTVKEDKFVALMGLAKYVQTLVKTRYFAGLWQKHFASQLLWWPCPSTYTQETYIAPSWSWASWAGPVFCPCRIKDLDSSQERIHIQHIEVQTLTNDPFGPVISGSVSMTGTLIRARLRYRTLDSEDEDIFVHNHLDVLGPGLDRVDYQAEADIEGKDGFVYLLHVKDDEGLLLQLHGTGLRHFLRFGAFRVRPFELENTSTSYLDCLEATRSFPLLQYEDRLQDPDLEIERHYLDGFKLDGKTMDTLTIF